MADPDFTDLVAINPERVRLVDAGLAARRVAALQRDNERRFTTLLGLRRDGLADDATGPTVVLGATADVPPCGTERDRAVVLGPDRRCLVRPIEQRVTVLDWDVDVAPFRLEKKQASSIAELMGDLEDTTSFEPIETPTPPPDAELLQDWNDWNDPVCTRPKVRVLGPVDVMAAGGSRDGIRNVASTIEFIIYLAFRERGVTKDRAAEDLGWSPATVQNRARDARRMMGLREDGTEWLPDAATTESARHRGVPTYELRPGVLLDAALFERAATSDLPRGDLLLGEPFGELRPGGYGWLLEGDRHDLRLASIVDDATTACSSAHRQSERS
ncbi:hypothetical protein [Nocardioides bruguierae]|uniref:Uncharacterized protein n=1 Tax=Nocardioides bruguierae TaxID=2945102 RepID=A0A9X2DA30_9ACTN|nr:hypothetical protein [Nocardioides bruguierae]MCM0621946.1 hypothetical protein [Nocardioides bruguierae]